MAHEFDGMTPQEARQQVNGWSPARVANLLEQPFPEMWTEAETNEFCRLILAHVLRVIGSR